MPVFTPEIVNSAISCRFGGRIKREAAARSGNRVLEVPDEAMERWQQPGATIAAPLVSGVPFHETPTEVVSEVIPKASLQFHHKDIAGKAGGNRERYGF